MSEMGRSHDIAAEFPELSEIPACFTLLAPGTPELTTLLAKMGGTFDPAAFAVLLRKKDWYRDDTGTQTYQYAVVLSFVILLPLYVAFGFALFAGFREGNWGLSLGLLLIGCLITLPIAYSLVKLVFGRTCWVFEPTTLRWRRALLWWNRDRIISSTDVTNIEVFYRVVRIHKRHVQEWCVDITILRGESPIKLLPWTWNAQLEYSWFAQLLTFWWKRSTQSTPNP